MVFHKRKLISIQQSFALSILKFGTKIFKKITGGQKLLKVSVIIPVHDEEKTIADVLMEVKKLNPFEIIIVANGASDYTLKIIENFRCKLLTFNHALGNDVGRALGAQAASGDILLFLDGDIIIKHEQLFPFIEALQSGYDIALNDLSFLVNRKIRPHYTTVSKLAVNAYLKQNRLSLNSILAIPHAITYEAVRKIGWQNLADPILTQAIAVSLNLKFCAPQTVDVIHTNKIRTVHKQMDPNSHYPITTSRIIGDHLCAINYLVNKYGARSMLPKKNINQHIPTHSIPEIPIEKKAKYSAIIVNSSDNPSLPSIIDEAKKAGLSEIIIVQNQSTPEMKEALVSAGAIVIEYHQQFHPHFARLTGLMQATADICLFLSDTQAISAHDLQLFIQMMERGADIVLTDRKKLLDLFEPSDTVNTGQYFVNIALNRPDLLNTGLTFLPHAIHKRALKSVGIESIIQPSLAHVKSILSGLDIQVLSSKIPLTRKNERPITNSELLGDQLEAFHYFIRQSDPRGGYHDGGRKRELLSEKGEQNE
jgi:hypothetical protein